jgi:hypothetical protein
MARPQVLGFDRVPGQHHLLSATRHQPATVAGDLPFFLGRDDLNLVHGETHHFEAYRRRGPYVGAMFSYSAGKDQELQKARCAILL